MVEKIRFEKKKKTKPKKWHWWIPISWTEIFKSNVFERNPWSGQPPLSLNYVEAIHHVTRAASLTTFPVSSVWIARGGSCRKWCFKAHGCALRDIINYTWTLYRLRNVAPFSLLSPRIISRLLWEACIDNLNKISIRCARNSFHCFDLALAMDYLFS